MSDEQIVYISPEDDLTSVRERLGRVASKKVTLVVPTHSQLRSHVAWKLLYARARDLEKEVLIVSSDPQIRSVALAVNFKVATSLEAAASGKSKQVSRPGRSAAGGRTRSSSTSVRSGTRGSSEARSGSLRSRHQLSGEAQYGGSKRPPVQQGPESRPSRNEEATTGAPSSPRFNLPGAQFGPPYDFQVDTTPPIQPLSQDQLDEEPDLLLEDYHRSQDIRQAALGSQAGRNPQVPSNKRADQGSRVPADDPFIDMDDVPPSPSIREQRGAVPIEPFDTGEHMIQDVPDMPTDILEPRSHSWVEPTPEDEQDVVGPARTFDVRPHRQRGPARPPAASARNEVREVPGGEDDLPPIEDRPTLMTPQSAPAPRRSSRELAGTGRRSQPLDRRGRTSRPLDQRGRTSQQLPQRERAPQTAQASQQPGPRTVSRVGPSSRAAGSSHVSRRPLARPGASRRSTAVIVIAAIILVLIAVASVAYFGPSAEVSLTLQTKSYNHDLTLQAQAGNAAPGGVAGQLQTRTFSKNGMVKATGTRQVGTVAATGSVTFTNNGSRPVIVPSNTIVTTSNGVQFATQAEPSVTPNGAPGSTVLVPVKAVQSGNGGNVKAGAITVIPPDSLSNIAKTNNGMAVSDIKLSVTNDAAFTNGGMGNAYIVQKNDLDTAKKDLHGQLQTDIDAWVKQWSTSGVHGNPAVADTFANAPQQDQTFDDPNVPVTLNVNVSLLYVSNDALQKVAIAQLNDLMSKDSGYRGDQVLQGSKAPVKLDQAKPPTGDTRSMTLNFKASTLAMPIMQEDDIRSKIVGQSIDNATTELSKMPGVQHVDIKPSPGFVTWVPFWTGHVNVKFIAGTTPPPKK